MSGILGTKEESAGDTKSGILSYITLVYFIEYSWVFLISIIIIIINRYNVI